jgi:tripartite-type tricarboxylate transporter receptor subunit TctC
MAWAQAYPTRPVRLLIGFAPGGTQDVIGRLLGQWLTDRLGQQVIIENRPGAASNIAAEAAIRSPPDGYTLFMIGPNNAINASVYDKLGFDIVRDSAPVAGIMRVPNVMEVNPAVPVTSVPEFIAYAKANPGKINFASGGVGTSVHVSGELFKMMTGVNMQHVTYRGAGPALTDLLAGQVHLMFDNLPSSVEHIRAGKLRARGDHDGALGRAAGHPDRGPVRAGLRGQRVLRHHCAQLGTRCLKRWGNAAHCWHERKKPFNVSPGNLETPSRARRSRGFGGRSG